jgi:hypothetical protein
MNVDLFTDKIIQTYKSSIQFRVGFAVMIILTGLIIILLNALNIFSFPGELKSIIGISGTLVSSICAFPIKEIVDRKNQIKLINELSFQYKNSEGAEKQKLEELFWKLVEKNVIG